MPAALDVVPVAKQENVSAKMWSTNLWKKQPKQMAIFLVLPYIMQQHQEPSHPSWIGRSTAVEKQ